MPSETVVLPRELTAEDGYKALLIGEFYEEQIIDCDECEGTGCGNDGRCDECNGVGYHTHKHYVSWDNIKEIYKAIVKHAENKELDNVP